MKIFTDIISITTCIILILTFFNMLVSRIKESYQIYIHGKNLSLGSNLIPFIEVLLIIIVSSLANSFDSWLEIASIDVDLRFKIIFMYMGVCLIITYLITFGLYLVSKRPR